MAQRGGLSHIHYKETKGLKVNAGQFVTSGSILTRQGDKWKAGLNVTGKGTLYARVNGKVYFTKKKGNYRKNKLSTFINICPIQQSKTLVDCDISFEPSSGDLVLGGVVQASLGAQCPAEKAGCEHPV